MKVIDAFPVPNAVGVKPLCEGKLSAMIIEQNEVWRERMKRQGTISLETLQKHDRRRIKYKLKPDQCQSFARYQIDGHWFCRKHAAFHVLDNLAEIQHARR